MTIATQNRVAGPFVGNGTQTVFPFTYKVFEPSDVRVTRRHTGSGTETVLVIGADYTVQLNPNQNHAPGGTVTTASPLPTGYTLLIASNVPALQPIDIQNQGGFYAEIIEDGLDRATILAQQTAAQTDRCLRVALDSPAQAPILAAPGQYLAFDAGGQLTTALGTGADAALRSDLAAPTGPSLIGFQGETSLQAMLNRLNERIFDARRWGVTGDGTDRTSELHAVIDACEAAGGGFILLPRGVIGTTGMVRTAVLGVPWRMIGHGHIAATTLRKIGTSSAPVFQLNGPTSAYDWAGGFQDMAFDGPFGVPSPAYDGLHLRNIARCVTDRIRVARCNTGVNLEGALILNFNDCSVEANTNGYVSRRTGPSPYNNLICWRGGACRGNAGWAFDLGEGEALVIDSVDVSGNGTPSTGYTGAIIVRDTVDNEFGYARVTLRNLYIEANHSRAIFVENAGGLYLIIDNVAVLAHLSVPTFPPVEIGNIALSRIQNGSLLLCDTHIYAQISVHDGSLISNLNDTSALRHTVALRTSGPAVNLSLANGTIQATPTTLGVFGSAGTAKPTITGSRSGGTALESILNAMVAMGFWNDATTA